MNHNSTRHMLLMALCCLIPLALIAAVSIFGFSLGSLSGLLPYALVLLCPLMMIFMMRGMGHEHGDEHAQHHADTHHPEIGRGAKTDTISTPK